MRGSAAARAPKRLRGQLPKPRLVVGGELPQVPETPAQRHLGDGGRGDCWHLADTKNGQPRLMLIHPMVAVCARNLEPGPKITVQSNFRKAASEAGMAGLHFHDLRHSAAPAMINAGVDLYSVGAVLGHKDSRSTKRYSHLNIEALAGAVGGLARNPHTPYKRKGFDALF